MNRALGHSRHLRIGVSGSAVVPFVALYPMMPIFLLKHYATQLLALREARLDSLAAGGRPQGHSRPLAFPPLNPVQSRASSPRLRPPLIRQMPRPHISTGQQQPAASICLGWRPTSSGRVSCCRTTRRSEESESDSVFYRHLISLFAYLRLARSAAGIPGRWGSASGPFAAL